MDTLLLFLDQTTFFFQISPFGDVFSVAFIYLKEKEMPRAEIHKIWEKREN